MGVSASLGEAGGVWLRAALAKTAKTKAVPIRMIELLLVVSLPPPGAAATMPAGAFQSASD